MPDITQRIADIIAAHRPKRLRGEPEVEECSRGCTYVPGSWYIHLAEMLVSELGLTREDAEYGYWIGHNYHDQAAYRYVTEWVRE